MDQPSLGGHPLSTQGSRQNFRSSRHGLATVQNIGFGEALDKTEDDLLKTSTFSKETEKEKTMTGTSGRAQEGCRRGEGRERLSFQVSGAYT